MRQNKQIVESPGAPNENEIWLDDELNLKSYKAGKWNELTPKPVPQVQADWNQADNTKEDFIKNKPTIPDAQIQSDWTQTNTSALDYIKNKPTGIIVSEDVTGVVVCTASEYEEIDPKVATVLYLITPDLP